MSYRFIIASSCNNDNQVVVSHGHFEDVTIIVFSIDFINRVGLVNSVIIVDVFVRVKVLRHLVPLDYELVKMVMHKMEVIAIVSVKPNQSV